MIEDARKIHKQRPILQEKLAKIDNRGTEAWPKTNECMTVSLPPEYVRSTPRNEYSRRLGR